MCETPKRSFEISQKLVTAVIVNSLLPRKYNKSQNIIQYWPESVLLYGITVTTGLPNIVASLQHLSPVCALIGVDHFTVSLHSQIIIHTVSQNVAVQLDSFTVFLHRHNGGNVTGNDDANSHRPRDPTVHCDWGNPSLYFDQPVTKGTANWRQCPRLNQARAIQPFILEYDPIQFVHVPWESL